MSRPALRRLCAVILLLAGALAPSCGVKGPLELPARDAPQVTAPAE